MVHEKAKLQEYLGTASIASWTCDTAVVITVACERDEATIAKLVHIPEALREYAESVTQLVECVVPQVGHQTLTIIKSSPEP